MFDGKLDTDNVDARWALSHVYGLERDRTGHSIKSLPVGDYLYSIYPTLI